MKKFDIDLGTVAYGFLAIGFWIAILLLRLFNPGNPIFIDDKEEILKEVDRVSKFIDEEAGNKKANQKALLQLLLETQKKLKVVFHNREFPATESQLARKLNFEQRRYFRLSYEILNKVKVG